MSCDADSSPRLKGVEGRIFKTFKDGPFSGSMLIGFKTPFYGTSNIPLVARANARTVSTSKRENPGLMKQLVEGLEVVFDLEFSKGHLNYLPEYMAFR